MSVNGMEPSVVTLCSPDDNKTCFACCPPIRQPGYEHIHYRNIIERMLRDNRRLFKKGEKSVIPITGFSCWALGYLDDKYRLIGCMLHPIQNEGNDLRNRIDYGEKCRRESCPEEKVFSVLDPKEQKYWLQLADDLDSFSYSSRKLNPLFSMLGWGVDILRIIAQSERGQGYTREAFFKSYSFFTTGLSPRANAYLLKYIITSENIHLLKSSTFEKDLALLSMRFLDWIRGLSIEQEGKHYVHLLDLDPLFADFLRLSAGIKKIDITDAMIIKNYVDQELSRFTKNAN